MSTRIPFSPEDEKKVLVAITHRKFKPRDRCLIEFGLNTGYRAAELGSITIGQVWDGERVRDEVSVARRNLKGGRGERRTSVRSRTVPLNAAAKSALWTFLNRKLKRSNGPLDPNEPLFRSIHSGQGLKRWRINLIVQRACALAGLPRNGRYGSHSLRKSFCRAVYHATGHDINLTRVAMSHASVSTTQKYLEVHEADVRSAILAIG